MLSPVRAGTLPVALAGVIAEARVMALAPAEAQVAPAPGIDVAAGRAGDGFVIAWRGADGDADGVMSRRVDAGTRGGGPAFQVNTHHTGAQIFAGDAAGNFVVTWASPNDGSSFASSRSGTTRRSRRWAASSR